jgi:CRP-like cAMP-binding protein
VTKHPEPSAATLLAQFPPLCDLPAAELERLAAAARERRLAKGEIVFQKGDRPTGLYLIVAGLIKETCQSQDGAEKIIELVEPGQCFGEAALFLDSPYPFAAVALVDSRLFHLDRTTVDELIQRRPDFVEHMMLVLSCRVLTLMRDVESYTVQNPIQRVAGYLAGRCGVNAGNRPSIVLPATKQAVASRLGMTPEALSRILRDFIDAGLIQMQGSRIDVRDLGRLETFAQ